MAHDPIDAAPMSDSLRELARRGQALRLKKGTRIITQGDRGDSLYVVLEGRLRAFRANNEGQEVTLNSYGPGDYVGEMGLDGGPRSAHVQATEPSLCVLVTRPTLEQHLREHPQFAFELLAKVIAVARRATEGMDQLALLPVYERLRRLIDARLAAQPDGTRAWQPLPSQAEIARTLGCSEAMVSRLLKDLRAGGYVSTAEHRLVVLKPLPAAW